MDTTKTDYLLQLLGERPKSKIISAIAGILYFAGLWLGIDIMVLYSHLSGFDGVYHLCGVFGTISLIIINKVSNDMLLGTNRNCRPVVARYWMFIGLFIGFSAVLGSLWAMSQYLSMRKADEPVYPGIELFLQNLLIGASSALLRFGREEPDELI